METDIAFFSQNVAISGTLSLPDDLQAGEKVVGVVLCHGMANDRNEAGQHDFLARRLVGAGYAVLRFDFRGCGASGERGRMFIGSEWPLDLQAAITYLQDQPQVDPNWIGVVGSSWGGGVTVYTSAVDRRIRCAVSLGGPADGSRWLRYQWESVFGPKEWQRFLAEVDADAARRAAGEPSRTVSLVGGFIPVPPDQLPFYEVFFQEHPNIITKIPLEIAEDILSFAPERIAAQISPTPLLILHGSADPVVDVQEAHALHQAAREPKRLQIIEKGIHQLLSDETAEEAAQAVLSWINQHLRKPVSDMETSQSSQIDFSARKETRTERSPRGPATGPARFESQN